MSTIFRLILGLLHSIYSVYIVVKTQWALLQREFIGFVRPRSLKLTENILKECDTSRIKKLPCHLVVILGNEDISFIDLTRILGWSIVLGIPHVTFYDQDGIMEQSGDFLKHEFEMLRPNLAPRVIWPEKLSQKLTINGTNGFKSTTRVQLASYDHGRPKIVNLVKQLCQAVKLGLIKTEEIDCNLLDEKLQFENFPNPDLAIVTGKVFSTFGFLPWHAKITEFYNLPSHHNISPEEFINVLELYGISEQRYGK